jgi:hypothetical protein
MAVSPTVKVLGPYSPKEFSDISTLSALITSEAASLSGSLLISAEPITVLGNVFVIFTTTP